MKTSPYIYMLTALAVMTVSAWSASSAEILEDSHAEISAQEPQLFSFSHITTNDGLSQSTVLDCCQDCMGQMWFATHDGLNRYDGYSFTVYRNDPSDSTSIADNIIRELSVDSSGNLWIGTEKGLTLYDARQDRFRNFPMEGKAVTGIADAGERLVVAVGGGLRFFNTKGMAWETITPPQQPDSFGATTVYRHEDRIWIGTRHGDLFLFSISSGELTKATSFRSASAIQCIIMDDESSLWVATEGDGLYRLDINAGSMKNFRHGTGQAEGIASNYVRALSIDRSGRLWVGTYNGMSIMEGGKFTSIQCEPFTAGSLSQSSVRCISMDNQGGMWLGTWFGGINYWHPLRNRFKNIQSLQTGNSLNNNVISCITEDSGHSIWIGTNGGGVNHYDPKTDSFRYHFIRTGAAASNLENDIKAIYIDEEADMVYVGAHAGGLNIIDSRTGKVRHCPSKEESSNPLDVYAITRADESRLFIGTLSGLKSYDTRRHIFSDIDTLCNGKPVKVQKIKSLMSDTGGKLWIGGDDGLICLKETSEGMQECRLPFPSETFEDRFVQSLFKSSSGLIWIATRKGLYSYDERENDISRYSMRDGLPSDIISGIEEDSHGRLWISTSNGLSCFNPFTGTFRNYTVADGLPSSQFTSGSHCRRSSGEMMFGSVNGITTFHPERLEDNPFTPKPIFTGLHVFNRPVRPDDGSGILKESISSAGGMTLNHRQNSFTIEFSVTNYLSGNHNTFAYMLEGFDKEWYESGSRNVSYSNLPHGKYRFMVKAANNDGKWNAEPAVLDIDIKPVWYRTSAAMTAFAILLVIIVIVTYFLIVERKERESRLELEQKEKEHQEEIHQMKMRFFINISHEMRTPLTLITNPLAEMIARSSDTWMRKQLKYVERNTKRLLHLVNQLMDYRRAELGVFKLRVRPENAHKIIKENWSFYEKLAHSKKIRYSLVSDLEGKTLYVDGQYLELIINNLLSNAFKYTDSGSITVKAFEHEGCLNIEVSDTGTGIPASQQDRIFERFYQIDHEHIGSGIGLSLVQRLVELHHGHIQLKSEEGKGSTFTVSLPLSLSIYTPEEFGSDEESWTHTSNTHEMYIIDTERQEEDTTESGERKKGRLLIADDNEEMRSYMRNGLARMFDIELAKNGEEALEIIRRDAPDIVITDMMMPVMDGIKLCAAIKQDIGTSHIPVIMLSAKTDSKDELEALKAGADDFIAKPFSMTILTTKLTNLLRSYHRVQDKALKSMEIVPEKLSFNAADEQILTKAIAVVEQNMDNTDFSTEDFAKAMNMSRSNLHLKLKALTGESALDFIRKIRFKEACRLLKDGRYSISEISDMVGFNTPSYFATCFKKYMGCLPTEWIRKNKV